MRLAVCVLFVLCVSVAVCAGAEGGGGGRTVVSVQNLEIAALDRVTDFEEYLTFTVDEGQRLQKPLKARAGQVLLVRFELAAAGEHNGGGKLSGARQAFFALKHATQPQSQVTVRTVASKGRFIAKLELTRDVLQSNHLTEGEYEMQLLVGDPSFANAVSWELGTLLLKMGKMSEPVSPPPSKPQALPEIHHVFQVSEHREMTVLPTIFCGLLLVALVVLLALWKLSGANLGRLPRSFGGKINALLFFAALGSILALLALFWLQLKLEQTLLGLLVLAPLAVLFGNLLLRELAGANPEQEAEPTGKGK